MLHRGLIFGMGAAWLVVLAVFLFDLLVSRRGWCGHLCPVGAFYSLLGTRSPLRVRADRRDQCNDCMDCFAVCPEPQVIRPALKGADKGTARSSCRRTVPTAAVVSMSVPRMFLISDYVLKTNQILSTVKSFPRSGGFVMIKQLLRLVIAGLSAFPAGNVRSGLPAWHVHLDQDSSARVKNITRKMANRSRVITYSNRHWFRTKSTATKST